MKNNRIVKAYDSINPSAAQKQRMLDAILAEANLEEKPRKAAKRKEPIVYTSKPTKTSKRSLIGPLAACIAVLILAGVVLMQMGRVPEQPAYLEPTSDQVNMTVNFSYVPVLEKYRTALREGWSKEECEIEGISTRFYLPEPVDFVIGKRMLDINNDGRAELLIGHDTNIWDLYTTLEDGTPIQLLSDEQDGWQYYLNEDGLIAAEYFSKDDCYAEYYTLKDHQLVLELQLQYRDGQWMQQMAGQEWEAILPDSAEATMNSFERFTPDWIPLQDHEQMDADALEQYTPILEKYKTALKENWTGSMCEENDISINISTPVTGLGWCLLDVDDNGTQELIVADGEQVYDLYTLDPTDHSPAHILMSWATTSYTLCQDGTIIKQELYSKSKSWFFYKLQGIDLNLNQILTYRNEYEGAQAAERYYLGTDDENTQPIGKEEAGLLLARHPNMKLTLNSFIEPEPFYPDAELYYRPLRELYQRALNEQWDPPTCMENGLSLMVAHRGEYYDQLGYTIKDLDRNGVSELIITDGTNIYDLYTLVLDGEVAPVQLVSAMERLKYYLTEDNLIYFFGSGSASSNYQTICRLDGRDLILKEGYFYDGKTDPDHPWYFYDGENIGDSCGDLDVQAIIDSYKTVEIPFTPFE